MHSTMCSTGQLVIILAVLCTYLNAAEEPQVAKSFRKDWKFHRNVTFKYSRRFARSDNSFLYAVCSDEKLPSEMNCNVTITTPISPWDSNNTQKSTCNVELSGSRIDEEDWDITKIASIDRFEENRVIIVHWERHPYSQLQVEKIKITVLQMDSCKTNMATYAFDIDRHMMLSNVVIYPRSFAIAISNRKICRTVACTIRHTIDGKRLGEPIPFVPNFATVQMESLTSAPQDQTLYVSGADLNAWKFKAMHVDGEGTGMPLLTVTATDPQKVNWTTSNSHGIYGICVTDTRRIYCAQFNDKGPRMNATLSTIGPVQYMKAYNLKNDGMLLVTGYCSYTEKCRYFKATKIDRDGVEGKTVNEKLQLKCDKVFQEFFVDIAENGDDFCFYFACSHLNTALEGDDVKNKKMKFYSTCVSKNKWETLDS